MSQISPAPRERIRTSQLIITLPPNNVLTSSPDQEAVVPQRALAARAAEAQASARVAATPSPALATPDNRPWVRREPGLAIASAGVLMMGASFAIPESAREPAVYGAGALALIGAALVLLKGPAKSETP